MKTLIIGGSGFVGSRLLSELDLTNCINLDKHQSPFFKRLLIYMIFEMLKIWKPIL